VKRFRIIDQQSPRQQEIAGQQNRRAVVVENDMVGVMTRRRDDPDRAPAEIEAGDAIRPVVEAARSPRARRRSW
jgi:hypothetical protein